MDLMMSATEQPASRIPESEDELITAPLFDVQAVQFTSFQTFLDKPFDIILDRKVILKVDVRRLGLDVNTLGFLTLVAGPRYKPSSHCLKMVTTRYHTVIENKRYLLEQLQALVRESSALSKEFGDKWKDGR